MNGISEGAHKDMNLGPPGNKEDGKNRSGRILTRGAVAGLLIALVLIFVDLSHYLSRSHVFSTIRLGMPEEQAIALLRRNGIYCYTDPTTSYRCRFDDFWRVYTISISQPQHLVTRKEFAFKHHPN